MNITKTMAILITVITLFSFNAIAEQLDTFAKLGQEQQTKIREHFYQNYTPFIEAYVRVFVAQINCNYDFINEKHFNDLADNAIKHLIKNIDQSLQTTELKDVANNVAARTFIANYVGVGLIDAQATIYTKMQKVDYSKENECKKMEAENRTAYLALDIKLSALLASSSQ